MRIDPNKCMCPCHENNDFKHVTACCNGGYKMKASPQLIPPFEHQILDNEKRNHEKYIEFKKKANDPIAEVYPEAYLHQIGRKYIVLDSQQQKVTYFMQWLDRKIFGHSAAYQILVWSDIGTPDVRGLASTVFYDLLFNDHNLVVTDKMQSPSGKRLWGNLVSIAFKEGYPVYIVDLLTKEKTPVNSLPEIYDKSDYIWPEKQVGQSRLLCIAKTKIW